MSNPTTIDQAADEFVDQYGHAAVDVLRARAEAAAELDDELAAETWGKAADAAERKLQEAARPVRLSDHPRGYAGRWIGDVRIPFGQRWERLV